MAVRCIFGSVTWNVTEVATRTTKRVAITTEMTPGHGIRASCSLDTLPKPEGRFEAARFRLSQDVRVLSVPCLPHLFSSVPNTCGTHASSQFARLVRSTSSLSSKSTRTIVRFHSTCSFLSRCPSAECLLPQSTHGSRAVPSDYENEPHSALPLHPVDFDPHDMPSPFSDSPPHSLSRRAKVCSIIRLLSLADLPLSSMASFHAHPPTHVPAPMAIFVPLTRAPMTYTMPPQHPLPSPPTLTCPPRTL